MNVETQPDLVASQAWCVRRPDSDAKGDRFRSWELPGAPHLTPLVTEDDNSHRDLDGTPFVYSTYTCTHESEVSTFPKEYFKQAALGALYRWVDRNVPPPSAPPIDLVTPAPPALTPVSYVLDKFGNETGGLRTPFVDFPDRQWLANDTTVTSSGPLGFLFCSLYGYTVPFTTDALKSLYPSHEAYVRGVVQETERLLKMRFLQRWNARTIIYNAKESFIPSALSDDSDDHFDHDHDAGRGGNSWGFHRDFGDDDF
jgi:Alpha/beta hydrolase domain